MQFVFPTSHVKRYLFPNHINDLVMGRADSQMTEVFLPGSAAIEPFSD